MQRRLAGDGITLIGELTRIGEAELVARYGKIGERLSLCARGEDDRSVDPDRGAKRVSSEITLDEDIADPEQLRPILWQLAETVAQRVKKAGLADQGVTLKLKTAEFRVITRSGHLKSAAQSAEELFRAAEPLLDREAGGRAFRLIGIGAHDRVEATQAVQADLFALAARADTEIDKAVDAVESFGPGSRRRACRPGSSRSVPSPLRLLPETEISRRPRIEGLVRVLNSLRETRSEFPCLANC